MKPEVPGMFQAPWASPRIDVVIPTYNRARTLGRAIDSVLAQTLPVHQVIVIDDGSTDQTAALLATYIVKDPRVLYIRGAHAGAPAARNLGITKATGELLAFQDSDDEWDPRLLETLFPLLSGPNHVAFCSIQLNWDESTNVIRPARHLAHPVRALRRENVISTQAALIPRHLLEVTHFDLHLPRLQDWDLWLSLAARGVDFTHIAAPLVQVNVQPDSISRNTEAYYRALRIILRKHRYQLLCSPTAYAKNLGRAILGHPIHGA